MGLDAAEALSAVTAENDRRSLEGGGDGRGRGEGGGGSWPPGSGTPGEQRAGRRSQVAGRSGPDI